MLSWGRCTGKQILHFHLMACVREVRRSSSGGYRPIDLPCLMLLLLNAHCHRISALVHCRYHLSDHRGISERCTQNPARPLPRAFSGFCTSCHLLFLVQSEERCRRFLGLQYVLWECCTVLSEGHHNSLLQVTASRRS